MYQIKVDDALQYEARAYLTDQWDDADAVVLNRLGDAPLPTNRLKAIAVTSDGVDITRSEQYAEQGVVVLETTNAQFLAIKELVFASLFMIARRQDVHARWVKEQVLAATPIETILSQREQFVGSELFGKTLGVIGLEGAGALVANDAQRFGMSVLAYDPTVSIDTVWQLSHRVERCMSLDYLLAQSDYVIVHLPLTLSNAQLLDAQHLSQMKPGASLLNFSAHELVCETAVISALNQHTLSYYVCDEVRVQLALHERVICYAGLSTLTQETRKRRQQLAVERLRYFLETGNIIGSSNFPTVDVALNSPIRLAVMNRNIVNMVGQMSTGLAQFSININHIVNHSKGKYAYTLIDIDDLDDARLVQVVQHISRVEGVISVRVISRKID